MEESGWLEHKLYITKTLERLEKMITETSRDVTNLRIHCAKWGGAAGVASAIAIEVIKAALEHGK